MANLTKHAFAVPLLIPLILFLDFAVLLFVLFAIPVFLFRYLLSKIVPLIRKDFGDMLDFMGCICNQKHLTITVDVCLEGDLTVEEMRQFFMNKVVELKNSKGKLMYPECQQYLVNCLGYSFWKWDRNFNIENHIKEYDSSEYKDDSELFSHLIKNCDFPPKRSPWKILLLKENLTESSFRKNPNIVSRVLFQGHHTLVDGFSILLIMQKSMAKSSVPSLQIIPAKANRFILLANFIWVMQYRFYLLLTDQSKFFDENVLHKRNFNVNLGSSVNETFIVLNDDLFPKDLVKSIAKKYHVCTSTTIFAAITSAIRKLIKNRNAELPECIRVSFPIPKTGHPDALRNHFSGAEINLPVGIEDPRERLKYISKEMEQAKEGVTSLFFEVLTNIVGSLPRFLLQPLSQVYIFTASISSIAAIPNLEFFDKPILRAMYNPGRTGGNLPMGISCFGFQDNFQCALRTYENVMSRHEAKKVFSSMMEEMDILNELHPNGSNGVTIVNKCESTNN